MSVKEIDAGKGNTRTRYEAADKHDQAKPRELAPFAATFPDRSSCSLSASPHHASKSQGCPWSLKPLQSVGEPHESTTPGNDKAQVLKAYIRREKRPLWCSVSVTRLLCLLPVLMSSCSIRHFAKNDLPRIRYVNPTVAIEVNKVVKTKGETWKPEMVVEMRAYSDSCHSSLVS